MRGILHFFKLNFHFPYISVLYVHTALEASAVGYANF